MPIRYKVVYVYKGMYMSCTALGKARIDYYIGKWVTSPDWLHKCGFYPLVFSDRGSAKRFLEDTYHTPNIKYAIFKCDVKGKHYIPTDFISLSALMNGDIYPYFADVKFPKGTEAWEYVKLIKEIK